MRQETTESFTEQAESFNAAAITRLPETLDLLLDIAEPERSHRWLDAACGPGVVARALAPRVADVLGVDATPAMVELATREAENEGVTNASFRHGDVTELDAPDASFDGALSRFVFHHLPAPGRALAELRRVVKPGGTIVVADHLGDDDADALAWSQSIERLRDPSHWLSLTRKKLQALGAANGLRLEQERTVPVELDYADWLKRGPGSADAADDIRWLFDERPEQAACFNRTDSTLTIQMWMGRWRVAG